MYNNNLLWSDIPVNMITDFLRGINTPESLKAYDPINLIRFITAQLPNKELLKWRVALMSKRNTHKQVPFQIGGIPVNIGCFIRTQDDNNSDENIYYLKKSHIISPNDEFIDLTPKEYS